MNTTLLRRAIVVALPLALVAAGCGASVSTEDSPKAGGGLAATLTPMASTTTSPGAATALGMGSLDLIPSLVERLSPSIVSILVSTGQGGGQGSGVVWDGSQGLIVTNNHVVEGAVEVIVQLASGDRVPASVLATDRATDLAVVRVDRTDLESATFADQLPRVGELAVAMGNPLGFENSVTAGIVSGLHRTLEAGSAYVDLIQTDAPISPGNSGGALVNAKGEVIGLNSAGIPPTASANSIGFAIPSTTVTSIVSQLVERGQAGHAFLGIASESDGGARVTEVTPGSAAEAAGLQVGDVVVAVDSETIGSTDDLVSKLRSLAPGDTVTLTVERNGGRVELAATLGDRAAS